MKLWVWTKTHNTREKTNQNRRKQRHTHDETYWHSERAPSKCQFSSKWKSETPLKCRACHKINTRQQWHTAQITMARTNPNATQSMEQRRTTERFVSSTLHNGTACNSCAATQNLYQIHPNAAPATAKCYPQQSGNNEKKIIAPATQRDTAPANMKWRKWYTCHVETSLATSSNHTLQTPNTLGT